MGSYLSHTPIDPARVVAAVAAADHGGVASFIGLVRDHQDGRRVLRLEYSAYEPMAETEAGRIITEAEERWPVRVALLHRVGLLEVGDVAVAIAAASAHRAPAFDACRYVIEAVKQRVPIWKKEFYADGSVTWVDPTQLAQDQGAPVSGGA